MEDDIILKQHPENPLILDILIQTKKVIKSHNQSSNNNPENPLILDILIWLTPRFAIRQKKS